MKKDIFRYGDRVKITNGFYKGFSGQLIHGDDDQNWFQAKLEVRKDKNTIEALYVSVTKSEIKLVKKNTSTPK